MKHINICHNWVPSTCMEAYSYPVMAGLNTDLGNITRLPFPLRVMILQDLPHLMGVTCNNDHLPIPDIYSDDIRSVHRNFLRCQFDVRCCLSLPRFHSAKFALVHILLVSWTMSEGYALAMSLHRDLVDYILNTDSTKRPTIQDVRDTNMLCFLLPSSSWSSVPSLPPSNAGWPFQIVKHASVQDHLKG